MTIIRQEHAGPEGCTRFEIEEQYEFWNKKMRILKSKNENFEVKNETLRVKKLEYWNQQMKLLKLKKNILIYRTKFWISTSTFWFAGMMTVISIITKINLGWISTRPIEEINIIYENVYIRKSPLRGRVQPAFSTRVETSTQGTVPCICKFISTRGEL